jgi:protein gp37
MGETTGISWTNHTFNPWIGCTKVSEGCKLCYAETQNKRYGWTAGWGKDAPRKRTSTANWKKPIEWAKQAEKDGEIRRVFCASLADVFDAEVPQQWREDLWNLINETGNAEMMDVYGAGLEWLILTKRPENIACMAPDWWLAGPPPYVRLGVTVEDQWHLQKRVPELLKVWGGKNFVSYEPALGLVHFLPFLEESPEDCSEYCPPDACIQWIICGGESGAGCRPMDLGWARDVRDQCKIAGVPFFFKQIGGHPNKRHDPAEWPEDLRVQEFPE